jgi:hypothetical protein
MRRKQSRCRRVVNSRVGKIGGHEGWPFRNRYGITVGVIVRVQILKCSAHSRASHRRRNCPSPCACVSACRMLRTQSANAGATLARCSCPRRDVRRFTIYAKTLPVYMEDASLSIWKTLLCPHLLVRRRRASGRAVSGSLVTIHFVAARTGIREVVGRVRDLLLISRVRGL